MGAYREEDLSDLRSPLPTPRRISSSTAAHQGAFQNTFGYNIEQALTANLRVFGRFGWNEGNMNPTLTHRGRPDHLRPVREDYAGTRWNRPVDKVAIAFVSNAIKSDHQEYLKLGGKGFLLGDGNLNYGRGNNR